MPQSEDITSLLLLELRSSEVNEVLNTPPTWLVRWGIGSLLGIFALLLGISWFVQYPDLVRGSFGIIATNSPKIIVARADGKLVKLLVTDGSTVKDGQQIAWIETTADPTEVFALEDLINNFVDKVSNKNITAITLTVMPLFFRLGELQPSFQAFQEAFIVVKINRMGGLYQTRKKNIGSDIIQLNRLKTNLQEQVAYAYRALVLAEEEFLVQKKLKQQAVISQSDFRLAESKYLAQRQSFQQLRSGLDNYKIQENQKSNELLELNRSLDEQQNRLTQAINTLKSNIESWKQHYILTAPLAGKLLFAIPNLQENQQVRIGQDICLVVPQHSGYYGQMRVGQYNLGKIKIGQAVIIKFPSYPFQEFGTVRGNVTHIADVPQDSSYLLRIALPAGLTTNYHKKIVFRNGLVATAEIITTDQRLFQVLFREFRAKL